MGPNQAPISLYKAMKRKGSPIKKDDLLYIDYSNKGEWEAIVEKVISEDLEEEDYIPSEEDPDMEIILEDEKDETVQN